MLQLTYSTTDLLSFLFRSDDSTLCTCCESSVPGPATNGFEQGDKHPNDDSMHIQLPSRAESSVGAGVDATADMVDCQ